MKKLLFSVLAVSAIGLTSCKKDYTCTCVSTGSGYNSTYSATAHLKKKDAQAWCDAGNSSASSGGFNYTTTCSLD
jgi:hypothetical protein